MNKDIFVSVIMSVYNGEIYLRETIDSILNQSHKNFEFIIVNDASTDKTQEIITSYIDHRIIYLKNESNIGQTLSRNKAISKAKGLYIIQTDADDISLKNRIEKQIEYMEFNTDLILSGTWAKSIGNGKNYIIRQLTNPEEIKINLLFRTSITHSTLIIRKKAFNDYMLAYKEFSDSKVYGEDYQLYVETSRIGKIGNLPEVTVLYRRHESQVTEKNIEVQKNHVKNIIENQLRFLEMNYTKNDIETLLMVKKYLFIGNPNFLFRLETIFRKIRKANNKKNIYNDKDLKKVFGDVWLETSIALSMKNKIWNSFWTGEPRKWVSLNFINLLKIFKLYVRELKISNSH